MPRHQQSRAKSRNPWLRPFVIFATLSLAFFIVIVSEIQGPGFLYAGTSEVGGIFAGLGFLCIGTLITAFGFITTRNSARRKYRRESRAAALEIELMELEIEERKSGQHKIDIGSISEQSGGQANIAGRDIHIHNPPPATPPKPTEED